MANVTGYTIVTDMVDNETMFSVGFMIFLVWVPKNEIAMLFVNAYLSWRGGMIIAIQLAGWWANVASVANLADGVINLVAMMTILHFASSLIVYLLRMAKIAQTN